MHQDADRVQSFSRRALILGGAQVLTFGVLGGRLFQLQIQERSEYALLAEDNRVSQRLLMPPRGVIWDRAGRVVAEHQPPYRVRIVVEDAGDLGHLIDRLGEIIEIDVAEVRRTLNEARSFRPFMPVTVIEGLSWAQISRIAVHSPELPGVVLDAGLVRSYPHKEVLAHVLGYVGSVTEKELEDENDPLLRLPEFRIGKSGIEKSYDHDLRGAAGRSSVEVNALGREIRELDRQDGTPGSDITLSIDLELQNFCFDRLSSELSATAVVLDVWTGHVLAMVSVPSYEPAAFSQGLSNQLWTELRDNPRTPLVNKAIRGQYPPGSTFKMITALAALESGAVTPEYEAFCPGHMSLGRARFHCWKAGGHGHISLVQALAQSCDVYFYDIARKTGVDTIAEMARRFGLGEVSQNDLPGEQPGLVPTSAWKKQAIGEPWQRGETLVIGIGQGYMLATPLQLAMMTARIANGGRAVTPKFVLNGGNIGDPEVLPPVDVSEDSLYWVRRGMVEVVNGRRGTARNSSLSIEGIEMAGKTGTSQVRRITRAERAAGLHKRKDRPWEERHHALFVCYAPSENPKYAVSVVVEHGQSGSAAAAPIARDIMTRALQLDLQVGPLAVNPSRDPREG